MKTVPAVARATMGLILALSLVVGLASVSDVSAGAPTASVTSSPLPSTAPGVAEDPTGSLPGEEAAMSAEPSVETGAIDGDAGANPGEETTTTGDSVVVGPIARQAVELRARTQAAGPGDAIGTTDFLFDTGGFFGPREVGASVPRAGAEFRILDGNGTVIQSVITDAQGAALLDARPDGYVTVLDVQSGATTVIFFLEEDTRPILTATLFVAPDAVTDDSDLYTIAADHIELRARTIEAPAGQGGMVRFVIHEQSEFEECDIFPFLCDPCSDFGCPEVEDVGIAQVDDSAPAAGYRFLVVATTEDGTPIRVIDEATTGPDGIVLLDVPVGVPYVIQEAGTGMQSASLLNNATSITFGRTQIVAGITVPVAGGPNTNPDGVTLPYAVAIDNLELRLRYVQDPAIDGTAAFDFGNVERDLPGGWPGPEIFDAGFETGDSIVAANVPVSILDANNAVVDRGVTNELGELLLDTPVSGGPDGPGTANGGETYTVLVAGYAPSRAIFSPTSVDVGAGRDTVSGVLYVDDLDDVAGGSPVDPGTSGQPAASGSAMTSPSAFPSDGTGPERQVIADGVTVTGLVSDGDPDRAGTFRYFVDVVQSEDTDDLRYATAGEITFEVLTVVDGQLVVVDSGATDASGVVILDIPVSDGYFVAATDDTADLYGSDDIAAGQTAAVVAVKYVAGGDGDPSASASAPAPGSPSPDHAASQIPLSHPADDPANKPAGATVLPNTGAGTTERGPSGMWALLALMVVAGIGAVGLRLGFRRIA